MNDRDNDSYKCEASSHSVTAAIDQPNNQPHLCLVIFYNCATEYIIMPYQRYQCSKAKEIFPNFHLGLLVKVTVTYWICFHPQKAFKGSDSLSQNCCICLGTELCVASKCGCLLGPHSDRQRKAMYTPHMWVASNGHVSWSCLEWIVSPVTRLGLHV